MNNDLEIFCPFCGAAAQQQGNPGVYGQNGPIGELRLYICNDCGGSLDVFIPYNEMELVRIQAVEISERATDDE